MTAVVTAERLLVVRLDCVAGGAKVTMSDGGVSSGRRYLSGYVDVGGRIGGCRFGRLHVEVKEPHWGGSGEWYVAVQRTPDGQRHGWEPLTDAARVKLIPDVEAQVREAGFGEAWLAAFRQRSRSRDAIEAGAEARRIALWWDHVAGLEKMMGHGCYRVDPVPDDGSCRAPRVDVVDYRSTVSWEEVHGRLMSMSIPDAHVGWVTASGRLVPLEHVAPLRVAP